MVGLVDRLRRAGSLLKAPFSRGPLSHSGGIIPVRTELSSGTTLAEWRAVGDTTLIVDGAIEGRQLITVERQLRDAVVRVGPSARDASLAMDRLRDAFHPCVTSGNGTEEKDPEDTISPIGHVGRAIDWGRE